MTDLEIIKEAAHELECASAAFATLIERADTHAEKRALHKERDATIRDLKSRMETTQ